MLNEIKLCLGYNEKIFQKKKFKEKGATVFFLFFFLLIWCCLSERRPVFCCAWLQVRSGLQRPSPSNCCSCLFMSTANSSSCHCISPVSLTTSPPARTANTLTATTTGHSSLGYCVLRLCSGMCWQYQKSLPRLFPTHNKSWCINIMPYCSCLWWQRNCFHYKCMHGSR